MKNERSLFDRRCRQERRSCAATAAKVDEALSIQIAMGMPAAISHLFQNAINPDVIHRVLTRPRLRRGAC